MQPVRVWAPAAKRVELVVGESRIEASPSHGGWWDGPSLAVGTEYAISLDGGTPVPDPRSRCQPEGVHGPTRVVDIPRPTPRFRPPRLRDALIYELHVGTFAGAIRHLPKLVELGVTHVEVMPIAQFPGHHGWGYDGVGLYATHAAYGGPAGFVELVEACHARGLGVIVDVVHNHLGPEGAYLPQFGPYKTPRHHTPWGEAINLDGPGSAEVRQFLIESALAWLRDFGADGLRLDAIHSLRDTGERHFVAELVDAIRGLERELDRPLVVIGEYDDHDPRVIAPRDEGGWGLDAHWNDDFHHVVHVLTTGERDGYYRDFVDPQAIVKVLERGYVLDGVVSPHRGGPHGKPLGARSRDHLVAYVQSHDQIGNRAAGERLHQLAGIPRTKLAAAILFASPFVPMIFQGEEWAASTPFCYFADLRSPELRAAVRAGRKAEHAAAGWLGVEIDPLDPATRQLSTLIWDERDHGEHAEMLAWYRDLATARRTHAALREPAADATRARFDGRLLEIDRGALVLACNLSEQPLRYDGTASHIELASTALATHRELPPLSCALLRR
ncbi:MAG TPA: malto-oligosyltrehalose trehalohydrolase [Kofleriaceae bacterium]|nr:malto-oligosyltrehalose trehalohydrolase [Kofleriaceae bacterium]